MFFEFFGTSTKGAIAENKEEHHVFEQIIFIAHFMPVLSIHDTSKDALMISIILLCCRYSRNNSGWHSYSGTCSTYEMEKKTKSFVQSIDSPIKLTSNEEERIRSIPNTKHQKQTENVDWL